MSIFNLKELIAHINQCSAEINGKWVPARPVGMLSLKQKLKAIKLVLTGKADVVVWPEGQ